MKNNELIKILENEGIPYAVIHGEYDDASYKLENNLFVPDIDIVLQTKSRKIISILMGDEVAPRREFITSNALDVANLDI